MVSFIPSINRRCPIERHKRFMAAGTEGYGQTSMGIYTNSKMAALEIIRKRCPSTLGPCLKTAMEYSGSGPQLDWSDSSKGLLPLTPRRTGWLTIVQQ